MVYIQFDVDGELPVMTVGTQVVGARHSRLPYRSQERFGTQLLEAGLMAAGARNIPLVGRRDGKLQQFGQRCGAGPMHGRTYGHFHGFQV